MSEPILNAGYTEVDGTGRAPAYVRHLDRMTASAQVRGSKRRTFQALELRPGDAVLDLGCGTGEDARALAALVGPHGRVVGVGKSAAMIATARQRAAGLNLPLELWDGKSSRVQQGCPEGDASGMLDLLLLTLAALRANAVAERRIGTLRRECLDHLIVFNERHLHAVLAEFAAFYNGARPHRRLRLETPLPADRPALGPIRARPVLGGLHRTYERAA